MRNFFLVSVSLLALMSCDAAPSTEPDSATTPTAPSSLSKPSAQITEVDGVSFRVLESGDRRSAFVGNFSNQDSYTGSDVEVAAQQVTGCSATIVPGEWAFLGDLKSFELNNLRRNVTRPFPAWQVLLNC